LFQGVGDGQVKEGIVAELNKLNLLVPCGCGIQPQ